MLHRVASSAKQAAIGTVGRRIAARAPRRTDLALGTWGLEVAADGTLARNGVRLGELTDRFGSPLQVVSADALRARAHEALAPHRNGDGADVYYSYKTNPIPGVLSVLHHEGIGAEVISAFELWLAMRLGVPAERIIYNGPAKSTESLQLAVERGIKVVNVNSSGEMWRIASIADERNVRARVGIRISMPYMWGGQFGLAAASPQVDETVRMALATASLDLVGLHFHCGFPLRTADDMAMHVNHVLDYCWALRDRTGWFPALIDLGGSLTTATVCGLSRRQYRLNRALATDLLPPDPSACLSVGEAARLAAELVRRQCAERGVEPPELVLEPGRGLTGDTQLLLTTVLDVKDDRDVVHAVIDAGMNIAEPTKDEYHQLFSVSAPTHSATQSYRLVGPICTPADVLYTNWRLPELQPGHVLAIMDTGAYYVPFSTSFSFPRPAIVMQDGDAVHVLRAAERFEDIVGLDSTP
jgi:diaminopimelate decarboxylase